MTRLEAKQRFFSLINCPNDLTIEQANEALKCYQIMFPTHKLWELHIKNQISALHANKSGGSQGAADKLCPPDTST